MLFKIIFSASFVLSAYAAAVDTTRFTASPAITTKADTLNSSSTKFVKEKSLEKRYDFKTAPYTCHGIDYGYADVPSVVAGINHLTNSKVAWGKPSNDALSCGRVSCSDNAAIWWCNYSNQPMTLDSFVDIAAGAEYVQKKCSIWDDARGKEVVAGEASPGPEWSVVVRKNSC